MCHEPTYAMQQICNLLDDLVGAGEQRRRHLNAERLGGRRQIDDEIEFGWLLDRRCGPRSSRVHAAAAQKRRPIGPRWNPSVRSEARWSATCPLAAHAPRPATPPRRRAAI